MIDESTQYNSRKAGAQELKVNYGIYTGKVTVSVGNSLRSVSLYKEPDKTVYKVGESLDLTGAKIKVVKSSATSYLAVTSDMISGYNPNKIGVQTITITYKGYKITFDVKVVDDKQEEPDEPVTPPVTPEEPDIPVNPPVTPNRPNKPKPTPTRPTTPSKPTININDPEEEQKPQEEKPAEEEQKPIQQEPIEDINKDKQEEEKPIATLGVQDTKEDSRNKVISGITSALGLFILLILLIARRNVKIYVEENKEFEFGGMDKLSKRHLKLDIDKFLDGETYNNKVKIRLSDSISEKLDGKEIEIKHRKVTRTFKIKYEDKPFEIILD